MEENLNFIPLLIVLLLAFIIPLLLGRVRWLPLVVGEIFAGAIIGHSGLNLIGESEILEIFSNIGLAFLMFLAGLEIDFDKLFPKRRNTNNITGSASEQGRLRPNFLLLASLAYLVTIVMAVPGGILLNSLGLEGNPWLLAFVLSATSLGVLLPIIKSRNLTNTLIGQSVFLTALLSDFATVILLTIFLIIQNRGLDFEIFSIGLLFLAFFVAYRILGEFFKIPRIRNLVEELSQVTVQIKVRGALAILMIFVVLAGLLGVELILGAFLAGMIISLIRQPEDVDLIHKLEAFGYGFFVPVFFIMVGVNLELGELFAHPQSLLLIPILLIVSVFVKFVPSLIFRRILSWRETFAAAFLLNTHLSLEIAVAVIGLRLELFSQATSTALVLFAVLTVLFMPILFNAVMPALKSTRDRKMVIYGAEDIGLQVASILKNHGEKILFIEQKIPPAENARDAGYNVILAETIGECLVEATKEDVKTLLVLTPSDKTNLRVCEAATCEGIDNIIPLVNDPNVLPQYRGLDVKPYSPALYNPALLALFARSPDIFKLLTTTTDEQDVREIQLANPKLDNQQVRFLGLPADSLVMAINRDGEILIPHGKTRLKVGDRITLLGKMPELNDTVTWLESPST